MLKSCRTLCLRQWLGISWLGFKAKDAYVLVREVECEIRKLYIVLCTVHTVHAVRSRSDGTLDPRSAVRFLTGNRGPPRGTDVNVA